MWRKDIRFVSPLGDGAIESHMKFVGEFDLYHIDDFVGV